MAKYYNTNSIVDYLQTGKVDSFKVTKAELIGFNDMEGWKYLLNVSVKTLEGYKNKRLKMVTN